MSIPQHTIDRILDRTDLVDLIGKYVKLKKSGRSYSGCCPFHQEKTPSFHVYRDKQYYHCFGCQANGNAIRFLMEYEGRHFLDVIKQLSQETGVELPQHTDQKKNVVYLRHQQNISEAETIESSQEHVSTVEIPPPFVPLYDPLSQHTQEEGNLYDLLELVTQFYQQQLQQTPQAQQYFLQRGLTPQTIEHWRLGYAPETWQHLLHAFPQDIEGLKQLGLVRSNDQQRQFNLLRDRVIFPIRDGQGRVVGFGGRALNDDIKPKYINSPDSVVFHKNQLLYGLYEGSKQKAKHWLMVEGYMDVIALHQNGIYGAVATLGTASNADHLLQLFKRYHRITLAFDGDQAGQNASRRTLEIALPLLEDGRELQFFILPAEHDPDSLIRQEGVESFLDLWKKSPLLSDFLFSLLTQLYDISTPEGKSQVMAELKTLTQLLPKYGSFKALLIQSFREKLGLTWKKTSVKHTLTTDANLSFYTKSRLEEDVIAILMYYPSLYLHFEQLRAIIHPNELLSKILDIFDLVYELLPDEQEKQRYYILGACSFYQSYINKIMQTAPLEEFTGTAEYIDQLAKECSLNLQSKYLTEKIKHAHSLKEVQNLSQQLNQVNQIISCNNFDLFDKSGI